MGIYQDPRMLELEKRHSRELAEQYDQFLRKHPELEGHLDSDDWSQHQTAAFRAFIAPLLETQKRERRELVRELGGKLSALSLFELTHTSSTC